MAESSEPRLINTNNAVHLTHHGRRELALPNAAREHKVACLLERVCGSMGDFASTTSA